FGAWLNAAVMCKHCCSHRHKAYAGRGGTPLYPSVLFYLLFIVKSFTDVLLINFAHGFRKLIRTHTNTSLSVRYSFILLRMRANRTEMFFSVIPTSSAMSL